MLDKKAKNNYVVAEFAELNGYYDVAVSRYYYYLYQNILLYAYQNNENYATKVHSHTIKNFIKFMQRGFCKNNDEELYIVQRIKILKELRIDSDYSNEKIISRKDEFDKIFKERFIKINNLLKNKGIIK